jgi:hypothetical protein
VRVHDEAEDAAYRIRAYNATRASEAARSAQRLADRVMASIVVDHGHKRIVPYDGPQPAAAKRTAALARRHGFDVIEREYEIGHAVEGLHVERGVGFRAYWDRGKTAGGTWHVKGRDVWKLVDISDRPIGVDSRTKTTKVGHRHDVNDRTRLVLVSSPRGLAVGITELERRIAS